MRSATILSRQLPRVYPSHLGSDIVKEIKKGKLLSLPFKYN